MNNIIMLYTRLLCGTPRLRDNHAVCGIIIYILYVFSLFFYDANGHFLFLLNENAAPVEKLGIDIATLHV